jgi:hypothetical protein
MISFITTARNDDYGKGFLDRFYASLSTNLKTIEKFGIPYEYLVIEWSPMKQYLTYVDKFKEYFASNKNLIDIVVKSDVALNERLNTTTFFEYFAKNVGIRQSKYDNLVILNSDIVIPHETMKIMVDLVKKGLDKKKYYRPVNRAHSYCDLVEFGRCAINTPERIPHDMEVAGHYPGDLFLILKETIIKDGKGYDETNLKHRTISQTAMDSEIMWNLYYNGCVLEYLNCDYLHIEHGRPNPYDGEYNTRGYINKPNWGFTQYKQRHIKENLIEISWI